MRVRSRLGSDGGAGSWRFLAVAVTVLGLWAAAVGGVSFALAGASSSLAKSVTLLVSTAKDRVNGKVSSAAALKAKPGRDGISLREALSAANNTKGSQAVNIRFRPKLGGKTIQLRSSLPAVSRNRVTLSGLGSSDGQPRVTIDARGAPSAPSGVTFLLLIQASQVTVEHLRFMGIGWRGTGNVLGIMPGGAAPEYPQGPSTITDIRIEDNFFDNRGTSMPPASKAQGVEIRTTGHPSPTHVARVTIAGNAFFHYTGQDPDDAHALGVVLGGEGDSVEGLAVRQNHFEGSNCCAIELGAVQGTNSRLVGTEIVGNTFGGNETAVSLNISAAHTTFENTLISANSILGTFGVAPITIGAGDPLGDDVPTGNVIRDTRIVNNLLAPGPWNLGIHIHGGAGQPSTGNRVEGIQLWNNTIVNTSTSTILDVKSDINGASGNTITGLVVRNSIFWAPGKNFEGEVTPSIVQFSVTTDSGYGGSNGNISDDPRFVSASNGDFHLQPGSPAINAGTNEGAPATDLDGRPRSDDRVDIGAYEA